LGSSWNLQGLLKFTIHIAQYRPLAGSSYIKTPDWLQAKHAVVNVQNLHDNFCFQWSILSALFPTSDNSHRTSKYERFIEEVNWSQLRFPVTLAQIKTFERNNSQIGVNVYTFDEQHEIIPVYVTKFGHREKHIDLLLFKEERRCIMFG
jgi:hypothetical protein